MFRSSPPRSGAIVILLSLAPGLAARAQPAAAPVAPSGYLGARVSPAAGGGGGILVREVTPGGPAARAGLKAGDRIVRLGDEQVRDVEAFLRAVATGRPGDRVGLAILRDGREQGLAVTL